MRDNSLCQSCLKQHRYTPAKEVDHIISKARGGTDAPSNLASICVLVERHGKTMLLTGDARCDFLRDELDACGMLPLHVDLFKAAHHGSDRNVDQEFFERVTADHYVISGDGGHGNPNVTTMQMIAATRGNDEYTLHFTFTKNQHEEEDSETRKKALTALHNWVTNEKPANCTVVHRAEGELSVSVDLMDPPDED